MGFGSCSMLAMLVSRHKAQFVKILRAQIGSIVIDQYQCLNNKCCGAQKIPVLSHSINQ